MNVSFAYQSCNEYDCKRLDLVTNESYKDCPVNKFSYLDAIISEIQQALFVLDACQCPKLRPTVESFLVELCAYKAERAETGECLSYATL